MEDHTNFTVSKILQSNANNGVSIAKSQIIMRVQKDGRSHQLHRFQIPIEQCKQWSLPAENWNWRRYMAFLRARIIHSKGSVNTYQFHCFQHHTGQWGLLAAKLVPWRAFGWGLRIMHLWSSPHWINKKFRISKWGTGEDCNPTKIMGCFANLFTGFLSMCKDALFLIFFQEWIQNQLPWLHAWMPSIVKRR